jgi:ATP-dependent Clp protease ATP-binding subunit ClpA
MVEPSADFEDVLANAAEMAKKLNHEYITIEHILLAMIKNQGFAEYLTGYGTNITSLINTVTAHLNTRCTDITVSGSLSHPKKTAAVERLLNKAFTQVIFNSRQKVEIADAFLMVLNEKRSWAFFYVSQVGIEKEKFSEYMMSLNDTSNAETSVQDPRLGKALSAYTSNLNEQVTKNKIDPVIGRIDELENIALALGRRSKNNIILIGDPGVGKTAIAEGLAYNIVNGGVPDFLKEYTVYNLDISAMLAGSKYLSLIHI